MSIDVSKLKFDSNGLIPAIIQDVENGDVLMMAWMNVEAVRKTIETGLTHFYSRSRRKLWQKGKTSGHIQKVKEILFDCDADCLLIKAEQVVAACHTGYRTCFHNTMGGNIKGSPVFDAVKVYAETEKRDILDRLGEVILQRKAKPSETSYTSRLLTGGVDAIGGKVMEEAGELVESAAAGRRSAAVSEAADLVYHTLVLLAGADLSFEHVKEELERRFGTGGLEEKARRNKSKVLNKSSE